MSDRLTVAYDATPLVGHRTGIGRAVAAWVAALGALDAADDAPTLVPWVLSRGAPSAALPGGARRFPYPASVALRLWAGFGHPDGRRTLRAADVVHGTNYVAPPTGWPTVVTVHDLGPFTDATTVQPGARRFAAVTRRLVAGGAWVHAPSEHVAAQCRRLLGTDRVVAVHHGPLPVAEAPGPPAVDGPYVLAVGTAEARKNLVRLVRAFALVAPELADLRLVWVGGPGPASADLAAATGALPPAVRRRVLLAGPVDDAERDALLRGAAALCVPSLDEGFGFPVLEGFAARVPVVAARAGALPEIGADACLWVDPLDVAAMAAGLRRAVTDEAERTRLTTAGTARLAAFDWAHTARSLASLYRRAAWT